MRDNKARLIAIYLPQFHPIPENDKWHGAGFTEWTNVSKAKPLFKGHYQPRIPADLGYCDLRVPETREAQAQMAREHGIEGFMYWHYWFGHGKRILERPFSEVLESGKPNFPFCLGWANASWTGVWYGMSDLHLLEQEYPGIEDYKEHFYAMLPAFRDPRYIRVDGKPLFLVYHPRELPDAQLFTDVWRKLALKEGLGGMHFVDSMIGNKSGVAASGFDASVLLDPFARIPRGNTVFQNLCKKLFNLDIMKIWKNLRRMPSVHQYDDLVSFLSEYKLGDSEYPVIVPNFDNTPRSGLAGTVLQNSTPELFERMVINTLESIKNREGDKRIVLVEAWNEWAEGNHLEPDQKFGRQYLEAIKRNVCS